MRKLVLAFMLVCLCGFVGCSSDDEDFGDSNTELRGKTFVYHNGKSGEALIRLTYTFENNGNVYNKREVAKLKPYDTKGCALYYKLEGKKLTIYYGVKGWEKDVQHTEYSQGEYFGDYLIIDDDKYILQ